MIHTIPHDIIRIVFSLLDDVSFISFGSTNKILQHLLFLIVPDGSIDKCKRVFSAIKNGYMSLVKMYIKPLTCYSEKTMILFCNTAVKHGHFEIVKWLRTEFNENGDNSVCNYYKISV